jgi:hypothetical protein
MKTKKEYGKKKFSGKKHNSRLKNKKSRLKNKKRTRMINNLRGGASKPIGYYKNFSVPLSPIPPTINGNWRPTPREPLIIELPIRLPEIEDLSYIEITNSLFQVNYKGLFILINLDLLSVDKLQYFINKGNLISFSNDNNFLGLTKNTIVIKSLNKGGGVQYRTGKSNDFIDIYEDITIPMIPYDVNLANLKEVNKHEFYSNVKTIEHPLKKTVTTENIEWLYKIMLSLNKKHSENKLKLEFFIEQFKLGKITKDTKIFNKEDNESDDLNVEDTKLIIEDSNDDGTLLTDIDGNKYVIVGYPDQKMSSYLDLLKKHEEDFKSIYDDHKAHFMEYMANLHNSILYKTKPIDPTKLQTEIHKIYDYEKYYLYIENFYDNAFTQEDKYNYNELASKCLNKPMMKINYVFLVFKKHTDGMYVPAILNFRQLNHKHHFILERLEKLIKTRLAKIYGIIENENTEEYRLWYSHYNYGDVFHIKTEYVHTMSNIQQQAYKYKNSITLEELIYMLSIPNVNLINLRLDIQRKGNRFAWLNGVDLEKKYKQEYNNKEFKKLIPKCKDIDVKVDENPQITDLEYLLHKDTKILLMFVETGNIYTFVYKSGKDNKFYIIKLKPNLCKISVKLLKYLSNVTDNLFEKFYGDFNTSHKPDFTKILDIGEILELYEVKLHRPINSIDYKGIIRYNPLLVREFKKISNTTIDVNSNSNLFVNDTINTRRNTSNIDILFQSPLVDITQYDNYDMRMPNPYLKKPFIVRSFLSTKTYKNELNIFKEKFDIDNTISHNYPINELNDPYNKKYECNEDRLNSPDPKYEYNFVKDIDNKQKINRIFFNPNNCGYNFIEVCEKIKSVVWIVPLNSTESEDIPNQKPNNYIGNFLYLNSEHIKMLDALNKLFNNDIYECFLNMGSIALVGFSLHVHVFKKKEVQYSNPTAILQQGSRIDKFLSTKTAVNVLKLGITNNYEYYKNFKCYFIIHDKG